MKELNINLQKHINTALIYALPLCVILSYDKNYAWFYEHYIQLFSYPYADGLRRDITYLDTSFPGYESCYDGIIDVHHIPYNSSKLLHTDIIELIIEYINQDSYLIIFADEYYLPCQTAYKRYHFVHELLIYGYNSETKELLAIGFDKNQTFKKLVIDFDCYRKAFEEGKLYFKNRKDGEISWIEEQAIVVITHHESEINYQFSLQRFIDQLSNYVNCRVDSSQLSLVGDVLLKRGNIKYGLDIYDTVLSQFNDILLGKDNFQYRRIHLQYEHKNGIYNRLVYVSKKYDLDGLLNQHIDEYSAIVQKLNILRLKYLKFMNKHNASNIKKVLAEMSEIITWVRVKENEILTKILECLISIK